MFGGVAMGRLLVLPGFWCVVVRLWWVIVGFVECFILVGFAVIMF